MNWVVVLVYFSASTQLTSTEGAEQNLLLLLHNQNEGSLINSEGSICHTLTLPAKEYTTEEPLVAAAYIKSSQSVVTCSQSACHELNLITRSWTQNVLQGIDLAEHPAYAVAADRLYVFPSSVSNNIQYMELNNIKAGFYQSGASLPHSSDEGFLCATTSPSSTDIIYIVGLDISGLLIANASDGRLDSWQDIPTAEVSSAGCAVLTNEFGGSTLLAIGGSKGAGEQVWGYSLNTDDAKWSNLEFDLPSGRPDRPIVSILNGSLVVNGRSSQDVLTEFGWTTIEGEMCNLRPVAVQVPVDLFRECDSSKDN